LNDHEEGEIATVMSSQSDMRPGFFRASLNAALIILYTFVLGVPCLIFFFLQPDGETGYWFIRTWARILLRTCGVSIEVRGAQNIPADPPYIIMSTHNSHFDIPVLMKEVPRQFRIVAKRELFKIPVFGWILSAAGYVNVNREDKEQAFASLDRATEKVKTGMPLLIFPEGTRSPDGSLGPFKKGGFVLAINAGAPIVPVVVDGTFQILPKATWRVSPGRVTVTFGRPIEASMHSFEDKEMLIDEVRGAISGMLEAGVAPDRAAGLTPTS
jgi:1-acyl-sn-glycerol-3-phosphate acyltransferase